MTWTDLKTLPKTSSDAAVSGERAAFCALREELVKKLNEVHGQVSAYNIIQAENANRASFKKLLSDEQQVERKYPYCTASFRLSLLQQNR
jgi:hypothetical protein